MSNLVESLRENAGKYPNNEAIVLGDDRLSYQQLWSSVSKLASFFADNGFKRGERVALLLDNSPEFVVAYYGVAAAGGAVVALNTAVKAMDLDSWIGHSGSTWVIANAQHSEFGKLAARQQAVKFVLFNASEKAEDDFLWEDVEAYTDSQPDVTIDGDDVAQIIYTSGTTGEPKGVTLTHHNLFTNFSSVLQYLDLDDSDSIVNVLPFYYSYGNSVLHTHMMVGGKVVLQNSLMYPHLVMQKITDEKVTGFSGVPSTFTLLLSRVKLDEVDLSSLKYVTQAGGAMSPSHIERFCDAVPNARFFVMYGQTEASARIAYLPPDELINKMGAVGIPVPGVKVEIRDDNGNPVENGLEGEICVFGENLMKGYWRNPEKTNEVLVDGWLKTGDLAHMDDDGYIFIHGRSSDIIKSGAHRISPKEIEEVIHELPEVEEVAVVGDPDEVLGELIRACIVVKPDMELEARVIKAHCHQRLAQYKIPKKIEFVKELPKTASGKIRRFLLVDN